jgi:ribosome recycling factor
MSTTAETSIGENDKATRKAITLRKRVAVRSIRRTAKSYLPKNHQIADEDIERAEGQMSTTAADPRPTGRSG